jgi:hypothetical protein
VRAACAGTTKKGGRCTMPAAKGSDWCYLHDPDPAVAKRRSRNASRAATLGNSKVGAEIRSTRLMVREPLETTISGNLDPVVRKRLAEITQLLQVYARLAELEIADGEKPRAGDVKLPADIPERVREWAEGEEAKAREREALVEELSTAMEAEGRDPTPIREAMGG